MDIRPLKPEEYQTGIDLATRLFPWGERPRPEHLIGKFDKDSTLLGVIGWNLVPVIDIIASENALDTRDLVIAMDQRLSQVPRYFFFIPERTQDKWVDLIKKHFGEIIEGFPGTLFTRTR